MKVNVKIVIPPDLDQLDHEKIKVMIPYGLVTIDVMTAIMTITNRIFLEDQQDKNDLICIVNSVVEVGY